MRSIWNIGDELPDEPLWRYFRTDRFIETLQSQSLYFPSARQFVDPFEGAVAVLPHDFPVDPRYTEPGTIDNAFEQLRRLTKISCWHRADYESDAMWQLYAATSKGVAVRTTTHRLRSALKHFRLAPTYGEEEPYWGEIRYVDLHEVRLRVSMEQRFFHKHRAFEWEREFRVIITLRMAEEFAVPVPEHGIQVAFEPATLVESIYLGPDLSDDDRDALGQACESAGLTAELKTSTLLGRPQYT